MSVDVGLQQQCVCLCYWSIVRCLIVNVFYYRSKGKRKLDTRTKGTQLATNATCAMVSDYVNRLSANNYLATAIFIDAVVITAWGLTVHGLPKACNLISETLGLALKALPDWLNVNVLLCIGPVSLQVESAH